MGLDILTKLSSNFVLEIPETGATGTALVA